MPRKNQKGQGWFGDSERHAQAGRKGGEKLASSRGSEYFSEIGRKGGRLSSGKFMKGSSRAREAGRKGGKARGG